MGATRVNILIVDDNAAFRENVKDVLELHGYHVQTACDGGQALSMIEDGDETVDLVLLDIRLPIMNGVETLKRIKAVDPTIDVIMVTAYAVEQLIEEALEEGAFASMRKPLDFPKLTNMIEHAVTDKSGAMILVADDDAALCENLKDLLESTGHFVQTAYSSAEAIAQAEQTNFDIMLLDMKLPTLNGFETYLRIRALRPALVVVIITGFIDEMDSQVRKTLDKSAYTCFTKPLDLDSLLAMIEQIKVQKAAGAVAKPEPE